MVIPNGTSLSKEVDLGSESSKTGVWLVTLDVGSCVSSRKDWSMFSKELEVIQKAHNAKHDLKRGSSFFKKKYWCDLLCSI